MGGLRKEPRVELPELQRRFGKVVLRRRLEAQLAQEKLADTAGVHRNHLSLLERGKHMPSLAMVHNLAVAFGVSMTTLMSEVEAEEMAQDEPPALPRGRPRKNEKVKSAPRSKGK